MDRGTRGRPADGTDEAVEPTEPVDAAVEHALDQTATGATAEAGPTVEAGPTKPRTGGPPAHWLADIRARAPWLLEPDGLTVPSVDVPAPAAESDVIPHGRGTHPGPWPDTVTGRAMTDVARTPAADTGPDRAAGPGSVGPSFPADTTSPSSTTPTAAPMVDPHGRPTPASVDRPADGGTTATPRPEVDPPARVPDDPEGDRVSMPSPWVEGDPRRHAVTGTAGTWPPSVDARPRDATDVPGRSDPTTAAPGSVPTPPPEPVWPANVDAVAAPHGHRPAGWTSTTVPPQHAAPAVGRPDAAPTPAVRSDRAPGTWNATDAPDRPGPSGAVPTAWPSPEGAWRVTATAADAAMPARLPLPAWPSLPEPAADDGSDWRSIERRLARAARLDHEQRRR